MNWLTNFVKPKLSALVSRRVVPENCGITAQLVPI